MKKLKPGTAQYFQAALEEIAKGRGRFDSDPLEHCSNTVENLKRIAQEALDHAWDPEEWRYIGEKLEGA